MPDESLKSLKRQLKESDRLLGKTTRELEFLKDSESKREKWLHDAKEDAGFSWSVSFDVVWEKCLAAYLKEKGKIS